MKKLILFAMICSLLFVSTACGGIGSAKELGEKIDIDDRYPDYYAYYEDGIVSVTNYNPEDVGNLPQYQELISYGDGAGLDNDGIVYYIYMM